MMRIFRAWTATGGQHSFALGINGICAIYNWTHDRMQFATILTFMCAVGVYVAFSRVSKFAALMQRVDPAVVKSQANPGEPK